MNSIFLNPEFDKHTNYRLLSLNATWVKNMKLNSTLVRGATGKVTNKRERSPHIYPQEPHMLLWAKGESQLIACDAAQTFMVRRVEYSNSMLVAQRRFCLKHRVITTLSESPKEDIMLPEGATNVVVASISRIFEAHAIRPQHSLYTFLARSPLTLEEIEIGTNESNEGEILNAKMGFLPRRPFELLSFIDLVRSNNCSATELAAALRAMGAVVHRGYVRLLEGKIIREALDAALTYVASSEKPPPWEQLMSYFALTYPCIVMQVIYAVYGACSACGGNNRDCDVIGQEASLDKICSLFNLSKVLLSLANSIFETHLSASMEQVEPDVVAIRMPFDAFWHAWRRRLCALWPGSSTLASWKDDPKKVLTILRGHAVCHRIRSTSYSDANLWWVPEYILPHSIKRRVDLLFKLAPQKWEGEDIQAFVQPLLVINESFSNIIVRYAREYRLPDKPLMYTQLIT